MPLALEKVKRIPLIVFSIASAGAFLPSTAPLFVTGLGVVSVIVYANYKKSGIMIDGDLFREPEKNLECSQGERTFMKSCIALALGGLAAMVAKIVYWNIY